LPLPSRQGVDRSEYNNGGDDGQGDDLFHVDVGSQSRPSKQLGACFVIFQQRACIQNRAAAGVVPCAGADRLGSSTVPAFRKWNEWPGQLVIVRGGFRVAQNPLREAGFDWPFHIVRRSVELNLARALGKRGIPEFKHQSQSCFCSRIAESKDWQDWR